RAVDVLAVQQHLALGVRAGQDLVHAVDGAEEGRLAAAGRPDEGGDRPGLDADVHTLDSQEAAVVDVEIDRVDALCHGLFDSFASVPARAGPCARGPVSVPTSWERTPAR